jgi:hypothetical protein
VIELGTPGVRGEEESDLCAEPLGIGGQFEKGLGRGFEETVATARAKNKQTVANASWHNHGPYSLRQSIETTAHIGGLSRKTDPRYLRTI